jgi:hypothetical protein
VAVRAMAPFPPELWELPEDEPFELHAASAGASASAPRRSQG